MTSLLQRHEFGKFAVAPRKIYWPGLANSRLNPNAFLRQRVLTFPVLIVAMLSGFKASVQNELNAFSRIW
jgi:hypothetical protein